jgi:tRNA A37 threonylcarbamoyladenosine synthetase subunit TsaC/SUA5/YrdC
MSIGIKAGYRPWEIMRMTIPQIDLLSKTLGSIKQSESENRIFLVHTLASLNSFAYHDPKKMPKLTALLPKKGNIVSSDEDERNAMKEEGARIGMRVP